MKMVCRFILPDGTPTAVLEEKLAFAVFSAECAFGKSRVRIEASCYVSPKRPRCVVDISTPVGEYIAQVLTGALTKEVGEEGFAVQRIERGDLPAPSAARQAGTGRVRS